MPHAAGAALAGAAGVPERTQIPRAVRLV